MNGLYTRLLERSDDRLSNADFVQPRTPAQFEDQLATSTDLDVIEEPTAETSNQEALPPVSRMTQLPEPFQHAPIDPGTIEIFTEAPQTPAIIHSEQSNELPGSAPEQSVLQVAEDLETHSNQPLSAATGIPFENVEHDSGIQPAAGDQLQAPEETINTNQSIEDAPTEATQVTLEPGDNTPGGQRFEQAVSAVRSTPTGDDSADLSRSPAPGSRRAAPRVTVKIGRIDVHRTPVPAPRPVLASTPNRSSSLTSFLGWRR
jgi:hypothetical protein